MTSFSFPLAAANVAMFVLLSHASPGLFALNRFVTIATRSASLTADLGADPNAFDARALLTQILFWTVWEAFSLRNQSCFDRDSQRAQQTNFENVFFFRL